MEGIVHGLASRGIHVKIASTKNNFPSQCRAVPR